MRERFRCWAVIGMLALAPGCAPRAGKQAAHASQPAALVSDPPPGEDGEVLQRAVDRMDAGDLKGAMELLTGLRQRHPNNALVLHELALAYRLMKQPERAVELLSPFESQLPAETIANLASALDEAGHSGRAEALLRAALRRYPRAGVLYSELGTTLFNAGKAEEGIESYLHGTEAEPGVSSNHLNLARAFGKTRARGLSLIYGEYFRVLEPSTSRSQEIGKLMFEICKDAVVLEPAGGDKLTAHISLAPDLEIEGTEDAKRLPLVNAFEITFGPGLVLAHRDGLSLATLHTARLSFLDSANKTDSPFDWSSMPLVRWLTTLARAGHLEAYDHWLYSPGAPGEFAAWSSAHRAELDRMADYVGAHPIFGDPV